MNKDDIKNKELIYKDETYQIIGAAFEVYNQLGPGFLEPVYQEALQIELKERSIPFEAQKSIFIYYKGNKLDKEYQADFVCYDKIIVEIKAVEELGSAYEAQLLNYLKATKINLGLLINFGQINKLQWKRMIL